MKQKKLPKLLAKKDEASQMIRIQIEKGYKLYNVNISSEQELDDLKYKKRKWNDYNETLLKKIFTEYSSGIPVFASIIGASLSYYIQKCKDDIKSDIRDLESILERLDLYDETTPIKANFQYIKTKTISPIVKFVKTHLITPKGLASIIFSIIAGLMLIYMGC